MKSRSIKKTSRKPRSRKPRSRKSRKFRRSRSIGKNKKSRKRNSKNLLAKALVGTAGIIGAKYIKNKFNVDHNKRLIYEESELVASGSKPDYADILNVTTDDDKLFKVRGPNYFNNKIKIHSLGPLYETIDMKIFKDTTIPRNLFDKFKQTQIKENTTSLPDYIIMNIQLPPFEKINYSVALYYKIRQSTIDAYNNKDNNLYPAIENYFNHVTDDHASETYKKHVSKRFKLIGGMIDSGTLDISNSKISWTGFNQVPPDYTGKPIIYENDLTVNKNNKIIEFDILVDISNPIIKGFLALKGANVSDYYDKTGRMDLNIGFLIQGENEYELPEVLLGETKIRGLELISNTDLDDFFIDYRTIISSNLGPGPDNRTKMLNLMNTQDSNTYQIGEEYMKYILTILQNLSNGNISLDKMNNFGISNFLSVTNEVNDSRTKLDNNKFFLFARYFYYTNLYNKQFELKSKYITYKAAPSESFFLGPKYIAKGTCFVNDNIYNLYECSNRSIKTYRFGFGIKNAFEKINFTKDLIDRINIFSSYFTKMFNVHKKLICISLLTPCTTLFCKAFKVGSKIDKRAYFSVHENNIIDSENKELNILDNIFINVPLSNSHHGFLFKKNVKSIHPDSAANFQKLINISNGENTFKTLVRITLLYYYKYNKTHILCYHCKSGKDRTSVCDSIVQATIEYVETIGFEYSDYNEPSQEMYEQIRKNSTYFLIYGFIITFYSTGIPGIKLNDMPIAKYLLNSVPMYNSFLGNSRLSSS